MPSLPIATDFTGAGVTEAGFKTAITNQREFLAGLLGTTGNQVDALVALGALGADTVSKTTAYTVIATDRGKTILCSGTFTLSLTAAATLGDGFTFAVINTGTGVITIDPASTEQIDGASTNSIQANSWAIITCTGTAFYTMGSVPSTYTGAKTELFVSSGTWPVPSGVTKATVVVIGGGGSVGVSTVGATGGTSSFGAFVSATGGSGGRADLPIINGSNGTGTVSSGTAIKSGISVITFNGGVYGILGSNAGKTTTTVQNYSTSSTFMAGTAGTSGGALAGYGGVAVAYITGLTGSVTVTVGTTATGGAATGVGGAVLIMY